MLGRFRKMLTSTGSQSPLSQASQAHSESLLVLGSPQPESVNDSMPVEIDDEEEEIEEEDGVAAGSKGKLTSAVWKEFKRVKCNGIVQAKCIYCFKQLSTSGTNGTTHLRVHLKSCVQKKSR